MPESEEKLALICRVDRNRKATQPKRDLVSLFREAAVPFANDYYQDHWKQPGLSLVLRLNLRVYRFS
jgi:hypothetical protein